MSWLLLGCEQTPPLERITEQGELIVATRHASTTYYQGADGPEGLEYELVTRFAQSLNLKVRFVFPQDIPSLLDDVEHGRVHMAAAGLTITPERQKRLHFSPSYQEVTEQLVYRRGSLRPRSLDQIEGGQLQVLAGSAHIGTLASLKPKHPQLSWQENAIRSERLLRKVNQGKVPYTVIDSNELARAMRVMPYLKPAMDLSPPRELGWAFPLNVGPGLKQAAEAFFAQIKADGSLDALLHFYYADIDRLNFVDKRELKRNFQRRLPKFEQHFRNAAKLSGFDWRLLAAVGYQESHWRPKAISPTGVRGIMMLTRRTAKQLNITDRTDPKASILGGARYLRMVEKRLPVSIVEPDRMLFTLAAYNIGLGHLEDARVLTERQGGDPNIWAQVKERLPLLKQKAYYKTLKHGYARGDEAVTYVDNIQSYFDLLVWYDNYRGEL